MTIVGPSPVCREWKRPAGFFNPKCTDEMFPIEGQGGCPVCVNPERIPPPVGCFGCSDPAEVFPARWDIVSPFAITGSLAGPLTNTFTWTPVTGFPVCEGVEFGTTAEITRSVNIYGPDQITILPLHVSYGAATNTSGCAWGNGEASFHGFLERKYRPGGITADSAGTLYNCPKVYDFMQERISFTHDGPNQLPNGSKTLYTCKSGGGNQPAFHADWTWENIPECLGQNGTPIGNAVGCTVSDPTCQRGNAFGIGFTTGTLTYAPHLAFKSYSWYLTSATIGHSSAQLHLCCNGYYTAVSDKLVRFPGSCSFPTWQSNSAPADSTFIEPRLPASGTDLSSKAHIMWDVTYPCGNPETLTLNYNAGGSLLGYLSGTTFPSSITIRRAS